MAMLCQMNLLIVNITSYSQWFEPLTLSALFTPWIVILASSPFQFSSPDRNN